MRLLVTLDVPWVPSPTSVFPFLVPFHGNDNKINFEIMEVVNQNQDDLPNSDLVDI